MTPNPAYNAWGAGPARYETMSPLVERSASGSASGGTAGGGGVDGTYSHLGSASKSGSTASEYAHLGVRGGPAYAHLGSRTGSNAAQPEYSQLEGGGGVTYDVIPKQAGTDNTEYSYVDPQQFQFRPGHAVDRGSVGNYVQAHPTRTAQKGTGYEDPATFLPVKLPADARGQLPASHVDAAQAGPRRATADKGGANSQGGAASSQGGAASSQGGKVRDKEIGRAHV